MGIFETFGNYKLTERLAFGGMAEVFLGTVHGAAGFVKPVVIKRLHPRLSEDSDFVQMLIDEARITAQLTHGNICQVLDLGAVDGAYYIAMEFISGEDLRTLQDSCMRRRQELSIEAAVHIVSEVLSGLDYAHRKEGPDGTSQGIVHRDISPQNILLSYEGEVKIIDFGIAKARMRLVQTQAGIIKGKFRYMAPEQANGDAMDHRVDIFAAGVVLYELLRGSPHAQDLSDTEVLRKMRRAEFEPLQQIRPEVPEQLERIIRRALARRMRERFSSAAEFRLELLRFLQERGVPYGRTELAALMQQVFDEERRRRRSGSFSGSMVQTGAVAASIPASRHSPPPQLGKPSDTQIIDEGDIVSQGTGAPAAARKGWVAFAPTTSSVAGAPRDRRSMGAAQRSSSGVELSLRDVEVIAGGSDAALQLADSERTLTYSTPSHDDDDMDGLETQLPGRARVPGVARDRSAPAAASTSPEQLPPTAPDLPPGSSRTHELSHPSLDRHPLHRQPTERKQVRGADSRGGPGSRSDPALREPPGSHSHNEGRVSTHPTVSTGFFSSAAAPVTDEHALGRQAQRTRLLRTLGGAAVVLVLGGALGIFLFVNQEDRPSVVRPEAGALSSAAPDRGLPDQSGSGTVRSRALIRVRSKPGGAAIRLCGRDTGQVTPAVVPAQIGRRCALELRLEGHDPYRGEVLPGAAPSTVHATLRRSKAAAVPVRSHLGTLRVTSIQVGTVYVNGRAMGRTPQLELKLPPGSYQVRMYFPTLEVRTRPRTVTVQAGRSSREHFDPQ